MDVQAVWALFVSYYNQAYGALSDNYILVWGFVLVLVALYALDIPGRIRNRSSAPQYTCTSFSPCSILAKLMLLLPNLRLISLLLH